MAVIINNTSEKGKRRDLRKRQTKEESKMWRLVRDNRLGFKFRRQVSIGPYVTDFYCREKQLVIELDGLQHINNSEYDIKRADYFLSNGIRTIRFWNDEINNNFKEVEKKIITILKTDLLPPDLLKVNYLK